MYLEYLGGVVLEVELDALAIVLFDERLLLLLHCVLQWLVLVVLRSWFWLCGVKFSVRAVSGRVA
jgi:hypothetical protein